MAYEFLQECEKANGDEWCDAVDSVDVDNFNIISVGAYIDDTRYDNQKILQNSKCDLLFLLTPDAKNNFWKIEILASAESKEADKIKRILLDQLAQEQD